MLISNSPTTSALFGRNNHNYNDGEQPESSFKQLNDSNQYNSVTTRRRITTTAATAALLLCIGSSTLQPAFAGLLDEYGTDFKTIQPVKKVENEITAKPVSGTGDVQIDPTLRGCTYSLFMYCCLLEKK